MAFILRVVSTVFLGVCMAMAPEPGEAQSALSFSKVFSPNEIGPGGTSTLIFTITNNTASPVTDLAFVDNLPAAVTISPAPNASATCTGGVLTAPANGTTISYSGGAVAASASCTVSVNVTASTVGTHSNVSGALTSSAGNSGTASDDLTVASDRPGFSKSFAPASIPLGGRSTLTYTIDNSANASQANSMVFTHVLPAGLEVANPANAVNTCTSAPFTGGDFSPAPGSTTVALGFGGGIDVAAVAAGATCTLSVDIAGSSVGTFNSVTDNLTGFNGVSSFNAGSASATLEVTGGDQLQITKQFTDDPVAPGGTATLEFTLQNNDRNFAATGVAFSDDLDAMLSGASFAGMATFNTCGGSGSGTDTFSYSGGTIAAGGSCTIRIPVSIPGGAVDGGYVNTTSTITGTIDGAAASGAAASDTLFVESAIPGLTKSFLTPSITAGDPATMEFTITNPSGTSAMTDISFTDNISTFLSGAAVTGGTGSNVCGAGSILFATPSGGDLILQLTGGNLPVSGSCTFSVTLGTPAGTAGGIYPNTTSTITGTAGGAAVVGPAASDSLTVNGGVNLKFSKDFTDDPVNAGDTATLVFTIDNSEGAVDATGLAFSDDLDAMLSGAQAVSGGTIGCSTLSPGPMPASAYSISNVTVPAGGICTITVGVSIPAGAATGDYLNTSSPLTGAGGVGDGPASATLSVLGVDDQPVTLSKEFLGGPFLPGETATLRFTIENPNATSDATGISFTDDLDANLAGLAATALPAAPCGAGSSISGTTSLTFTGGAVAAGDPPCVFDVTVQVPGGAASGSYGNTTSSVQATVNGNATIGDPAAATLVVEISQLEITKTFVDPVVSAGALARMEITVTNTTSGVLNATYTDDLNAMLPGTTAGGNGFVGCSGGVFVAGSGTSNLTVTISNLPAGESCTHRFFVQPPSGAATGSYTNTISDLSGTVGGLSVTGPTATASLQVRAVDAPTFSKAFAGPVVAGSTVDLTFQITNKSTTSSLSALAFSDDLEAALTGLVAVNTPVSGCGGTLTGSSVLTFTGGSLAPSGTCSLTVSVQAPASAAPGGYTNTTSGLSENGLEVAPAASASLTVTQEADLSITLGDSADPRFPNEPLIYTVEISNAGPSDAPGVTGSLPLPAGVTLVSTSGCAEDPNGAPTCTLGTIPAGGSASYTVTTTVDAATLGVLSATATASSGAPDPVPGNNAVTETTTVEALADISITKDDGVSSVQAGFPVVYMITVDNAGPSADPAVSVSDVFPAQASCGYSSVASGGATGNSAAIGDIADTLNMPAGSQVVYTATCTVGVTATGDLVNTAVAAASVSDPDTSNNSATDTDTITDGPVPGFAKVFAPDTIVQGEESVLTFTIDNSANGLVADNLAFADDFPAGMAVAATPAVSNSCGGSFTANAGETSVSLTAASLAAGASCSISVTVRATDVGVLNNVTGDLTSTLRTAAPATAALTVGDAQAPGFTKAFAPNVIAQGETSVLSFTIDNSANAIEAADLAFSDSFPAGMVVAAAPGVVNGCGGAVTATAGEASMALSGGTVAAGASCTLEVTVQGLAAGALNNVSSVLSSTLPEAAAASATLTVNALPLNVGMSFAPSTIEQFQSATLTYSFSNAASIAATSVSLSDTLPAGVTLASPAGAVTTCGGGALSAPDGGSAVSYSGGSVPAGSSCTVSVNVTSGAVGSYANTTEAAGSSLGSSAAASATLVVDPATTGTLTIVQNTDTDGAYLFSSATPALNFTITTAGGTGQAGPIAVTAGQHVLSQTTPDGVGNTRISCSDDDSSGQPRDRTLTVNIDPLEAVTCTITSVASRQKTVDTINRFLTKRADLILSSEPSNSRRLNRLKRGMGGATKLRFANGDLNAFLPFTAQVSTASDSYQLSTSFLQMREAAASLALAHGDQRGFRHIPNYRWDAWFEAQYKKFDAGTDSGHFAIAYFGADYLISSDLLVGALIQVDDMEDDSAAQASSVSGTGWMVGPYMTARLAPNLYFDGRVALGTSKNDISPFNTYVDQFTTDRWMAMAGITGDFQAGKWTIQPGASLSYFEETQNSYTDSLGVFIPSQTVSLGQVKIGPSFSGQFQTRDGMGYSPYFSLDAIYNFGDTSGVVVTNPDSAVTDGWRGRVQAGVDLNLRNGTSISFGGSYDGIGRDSLDVWGLSFELNIPIQKATAR